MSVMSLNIFGILDCSIFLLFESLSLFNGKYNMYNTGGNNLSNDVFIVFNYSLKRGDKIF